MKPSTSNLRQTGVAQWTELVNRLPTIQAMADGRPDTPDDTRRANRADDGPVELPAPYADPVAAAAVAQASARQVLADFAVARNALAAASAGARMLVPKTVELCQGCGEPVGARKAVTFHGEVYHLSPCEMRARRAQAKTG